ncbi:hypothetical protein DI53_0095 [Sphingobacterium deserti]|uniref:Uncharacterized protein n=1 Tax=Sphingobacterium deserti TaxID=1229276 RepID=A0A0B8TCA0_9SPHI|nr:hypothetical protein DI53_0095 [Sphingobacterium deserti]
MKVRRRNLSMKIIVAATISILKLENAVLNFFHSRRTTRTNPLILAEHLGSICCKKNCNLTALLR